MNGSATLSNKKDLEGVRRVVHAAVGGGALLLALGVDPRLVAGAALLAVFYNGVAAPRLRLDRSYRRPGEGRISGLVTYPLAVALLALLAPRAVAAGGWVVLAVADPVAAGARRASSRRARPAT
ncbi:MAG: hypothetical protein ACE5JG_04685 [Planctomycetota bacterium]